MDAFSLARPGVPAAHAGRAWGDAPSNILEDGMAEHEQFETFAGTLAGDVHFELADECLPYQPVRTLWETEGEVAPLGRTRAAGQHCADDRGGGSNGRIVFTAADGDELRAIYTFTLLSESPELLTMTLTGRFVDGGTGRFVHASGALTALVHAHTTVVPPTLETVWPVDFAFEGQVRYRTASETPPGGSE